LLNEKDFIKSSHCGNIKEQGVFINLGCIFTDGSYGWEERLEKGRNSKLIKIASKR